MNGLTLSPTIVNHYANMNFKVGGITTEIKTKALNHAKKGRLERPGYTALWACSFLRANQK